MEIMHFTLILGIVAAVCVWRMVERRLGESLAKNLPRPQQAALALALVAVGLYGGAKPQQVGAPASSSALVNESFNVEAQRRGDVENFDSSASQRLSAAALKTLPLLDLTTLPAWYLDDSTDSDGDGMPDFWEIGTHGNPNVPDSDLDRDGDGLTDLEEFYYQTNPRRADTDADGFSDHYEIWSDMNPLVKDDTGNSSESDENHNGIPDIWEEISPYGQGLFGDYLYFSDRNGDGWDDSYAANLPPATGDTFDVSVVVRTSRSAALSCGGKTFVLRATEGYQGTLVRFRLSIDQGGEVRLAAAPPDRQPAEGELWKAKIDVSFGGGDKGALIVGDGRVIYKEVISDRILKRFGAAQPEQPQLAPQQQSMQRSIEPIRAATAAAATPADEDSEPEIILHSAKFKIAADSSMYCCSAITAADLRVITNSTGVANANVHWRADHGEMLPAKGSTSRLLEAKELEVVVTASLDVGDATVEDSVTIHRPTPPCDNDGCVCMICPKFSLSPKALVVQTNDPPATINVISEGCAGASGGIVWTVHPSGLDITSQSNSGLAFNPKNSTLGKYTVTATSSKNSNVSDSADVYVVAVFTRTKAVIPSDRQRRTLGVAEEVEIIELLPSSLVVNWSTTAGTLGSTTGNSTSFVAPFIPTNVTITADVAGTPISIPIEFEVFAPGGYVIDQIDYLLGFPTNVAGAAMNMHYRVTPLDVSFYQVEICEVAMTSTDATGYYTNSVWPEAWFTHDPTNFDPNDDGWRDLNEANKTKNGYDEVDSGDHNPLCTEAQYCAPLCIKSKPHWDEGSFAWPIPNEWRVNKDLDPNQTAHRFSPTDQHFSITTDGTVTISKFGKFARRRVNSNKYYDENDVLQIDFD